MQPPQPSQVQPAFTQPMYVAQPSSGPVIVHNYKTRQSVALGIMLLVCGVLSFIFNIVDLAIGSSLHRYRVYSSYSSSSYYTRYIFLSSYSLGVVGHGFWCGIMFILTGAFGVAAGRTKRRCLIITLLVLSIIASCFAGAQIIVGSIGAGVSGSFRRYECLYGGSTTPAFCEDVNTVHAMAILLAVLGVVSFAASLWGSILACARGGCCCCCSYRPTPAPGMQQVIFTQQQIPPGAVFVTYNQPGYAVGGVPNMMVAQPCAPPAYYNPAQQPPPAGSSVPPKY